MYVLVFETDDLQFLIDPSDLYKSPRVIVRRGWQITQVWLDETDISFIKASKFSVRDQELILRLVRENFEELMSWWCNLKNDLRRGRLEHDNMMVD